MADALVSIGMSGLAAAQAGLTTTSENISNVNTAGYSRESVEQSPAQAVFSGAGYIGEGAQVTNITRAYNEFQQNELVTAQGSSSQLDTYYAQIQQIDNLLGSSTSGLSSAMDTFFSATQTVASNPSDVPSRQAMLSDAQSLADSFNSLSGQLTQISTALNQQVGQDVTTVNSQVTQIAALNSQIASQSNNGTGQEPNTLLDQRDSLIQQLNQEIGTTSITQSNGAVDVFVGNGQPLVIGSVANSLTTVPSAADPNQLQLAVQSGSTTTVIATSQLSGGSLTGLLNFRDQSLVPAQNALGQIGINLASAVNNQNEVGQDLKGNAGTALFSTGAPQVTGSASNTGTASVSASISNPGQLTTANYRLQYLGGQYVVTNLSTNAKQTFATLPQTVDGVTLNASGTMANGDSYTIDPTIYGASKFAVVATDPSQIAAATPVAANFGANNSGTAAVSSLTVSGPPVNSNLQQSIQLDFHVSGSTTTYDVVDPTTSTVLASGQPYTAGSAIAYNGWNLTLSGTPANGDTVTVAANTSGTSDNTNALLMAGLQTAKVIGGDTTLSAAYQQIVGSIGAQTQTLQSTSGAQDTLLSQAQAAVASTSGVNLDEEAASLLQYQQAYQASSQTLVTANSMFSTIIGLFANLP